MSLLKEAYKSLNGLLGVNHPQPQSALVNGGVMSTSVSQPVDVHHKGLSETFGENVHQTPRLLGTPSTWKEFGDQTTKAFEELGLQVGQDRMFPVPVHLASSEGRYIPDGNAIQGKDFNEMNWLRKDADSNLDPRQYPTQSWALGDPNSNLKGLLRIAGLMRPSLQSVNPGHNIGDNNYLGVSKHGASLSRGETVPLFLSRDGEEQHIPAQQNVTGHEYGHYLDVWMGGASNDTTLSRIAMSLQGQTEDELYKAWMTDDRTAHLDVMDKINTVDHPNQKLNNPREVLGKLYVTAMLNPTRTTDGQPFGQRNMSENIVRAMGVFFNPDQSRGEGHIQGIKDMRGDVMTSIANLLNQ